MEKQAKIYVAGHSGLVGSAITATLKGKGYSNIVTRNYQELDLTNQKYVDVFFRSEERSGGKECNNRWWP